MMAQAGWRLREWRTLLERLGFGQRRCFYCGDLFFPSSLPKAYSLPTLLLCQKCQQALAPYNGYRCAGCGLPVGMENSWFFNTSARVGALKPLCAQCARKMPLWQGTAYYGLYSGPLRDMCLALKFKKALHIRHLFADFLMRACACLPAPDVIVPIPQYPTHLFRRGYNQACLIAATFARLSRIHLRYDLLLRTRAGLPQEGLGVAERKANLRNAFTASPLVASKTVWLLDDVMTTGSTLASATDTLLNAGAKAVYALVVARTPLEN